MKYSKFFLMIGTSTVVMFGLMYLNTYLWGHVFFSETRTYMAIMMGAVMAFIMLAFMLGMYKNRMFNMAIFVGSIVVFAGSLWLVRSQVTVQDRSYMSAMIPHHSIAIMTSTRANLTDPRVRELADGIIYAQDKEIAEMRYLIADIDANGEATDPAPTDPAQLKSAEDALASEVVAKVDPEFLTQDDIAAVLPDGAVCNFTYTTTSPSVLAVGQETAVMKISGDLVQLDLQSDTDELTAFAADPLTAEIRKGDDLQDLVVSAGEDYTAGFRGQYTCARR